MTGRKPGNLSWETWIDKQISDARERGQFDNLPGHGQPIKDIDRGRDEDWWLKGLLAREQVTFTPPAVAVRNHFDAVMAGLPELDDEADVRAQLEDLNARIRELNRKAHSGPPSTLAPLDVEDAVTRWHSARRR